MSKTFLVLLAICAALGGVEAIEVSPPRTLDRNFPYLLRSSATTRSLPQFPEELLPRRNGQLLDYPPREKAIPVGGVVKKLDKDDILELSIGLIAGLKVGDELDVYRGGSYVGRIVMRKVNPDSAVGQVLPKTKRAAFRTGDNVVRPHAR